MEIFFGGVKNENLGEKESLAPDDIEWGNIQVLAKIFVTCT